MNNPEGKKLSQKLFEEAKQYFVGGVASALHMSSTDEFPTYIESGKGARVTDVDGKEYIDYVGGFGPMLLGYSNAQVDKAVIEQIQKGSLFAAPNEMINRVSKKLTKIIPCAELIAYQSTGTEANMLAFRMARAYTGKNKIIRFEGHYHGWSDEQLISNAPDSVKMMGPENNPWRCFDSPGQIHEASDNIIVLPWNNIDLLKKIIRRQKDEIAAVIMEPIMCNSEVVFPVENFLSEVRDLTQQNEVVLIFDEVITGFRLAPGGAQEYYSVTPDLGVFGKAMAGGYPLSSVMGKKEIMESGVKPRGTFNANPISIAACYATLKIIEQPEFYNRIEKVTKELVIGINEIAKRMDIPLFCDGECSIWQLAFGIDARLKNYRDTFRVDKKTYQTFKQKCFAQGVRFHPFRGRFYTSSAHTKEDIDKTLEVIDRVLFEMFK